MNTSATSSSGAGSSPQSARHAGKSDASLVGPLTLEVENEGGEVRLDRLRVELNNRIAPKELPDGFLMKQCLAFHLESENGLSDMFSVSSTPTPGAGTMNLVVRVDISDAFYRYAAAAADDFCSGILHD
jgi:hypothetical protein